MPHDSGVPLLAACIIVNPNCKILLLERNTNESDRFALPVKRIKRGHNAPTSCSEPIVAAAWEAARLQISELTTSPVYSEVRDNNSNLTATVFCAGVRFPFCIPVQIDYIRHQGYIWASRETIGADQKIDTTSTAEVCISELSSEPALFNRPLPEDGAW